MVAHLLALVHDVAHDGYGQRLRGVYLCDAEIDGGEASEVEIAVAGVGGGGVVGAAVEVEHSLALVIYGYGPYLARLQLEACHSLERVHAHVLAQPHAAYDACSHRLPLVAHGDGGAVVAQFGHLEKGACHNALKLGIAVEIHLGTHEPLCVVTHLQGAPYHGVAEDVGFAAHRQVAHGEVVGSGVAVCLGQGVGVHICRRDRLVGCGDGCVGGCYARELPVLPLELYAAAAQYGERACHELYEGRACLHGEVLEEGEHPCRIFVPLGVGGSGIQCLVGRQVAHGGCLLPSALHRAVVTRG